MIGTSPRPPASLYVAGLFSMGYVDFYIFLIPLYGLSLGLDAAEIGILVGGALDPGTVSVDPYRRPDGPVRHAPGDACFLSGPGWLWRRCFRWCQGSGPLLLLQLVNGAAVSFAWSGSQTLIAQLAEGDAGYIGRFSFFARIGSTTAPILAGAAWDFGGAWPAYLLGVAWGVVLTAGAAARAGGGDLRAATGAAERGRAAVPRPRRLPAPLRLRRAIVLIAIPAVAVTMAIMLDAQRDQQRAVLALCRLSRPHRAGRHGDRRPVRRDRDRERLRLAVRRPGDAARRPAAHDAERHRAVDPVDRATPFLGGIFALAAAGAGRRAAGCKGWSSR